MKVIIRIALIVLLAVPAFFIFGKNSKPSLKPSVTPPPIQLHNGDILFQSSEGGQGKAIQLATGSKYNHCGMIYMKGPEVYVLEANGPVGLTPYTTFINRGNGHWVHKRLKNRGNYFKDVRDSAFYALANKYMGTAYDPYFGWNDSLMYCSELVWKIYDQAAGVQLAELQQLKEFDLTHPIVKNKLKERFGENIPLEEKVISPARIYESKLLETVHKN